MTLALSGEKIAKQIEKKFPGCVAGVTAESLLVEAEALLEVAEYLKTTPGLAFDYLNYVTATDYYDYFEVVYHLTSIEHNHSLVLKTRCYQRDNPTLPSVTGLWRTADFQEREIYDLLGISFEGHPNLRRIALWEGFDGHPLRKDFL
jgi:NADH-quinone oxidoreductase subunit C